MYACNLYGKKNGDHGEYRWFSRNDVKKYLCSVHKWISIVQRFIRLQGSKIWDQPLAVYRNKKRQVRNITADIVNTLMRSLAVETYKLTKKEDIELFPCHSLRVGTCTLLFTTNYSPQFIKRVLRWRSESWQTYVRDLIATSVQTQWSFTQGRYNAIPLNTWQQPTKTTKYRSNSIWYTHNMNKSN